VFSFGDQWAAYAGYLTEELIAAGTEPSQRHDYLYTKAKVSRWTVQAVM
jgi:hypothetical protein